eukprot:517850-Prymnesium_polylepis.1
MTSTSSLAPPAGHPRGRRVQQRLRRRQGARRAGVHGLDHSDLARARDVGRPGADAAARCGHLPLPLRLLHAALAHPPPQPVSAAPCPAPKPPRSHSLLSLLLLNLRAPPQTTAPPRARTSAYEAHSPMPRHIEPLSTSSPLHAHTRARALLLRAAASSRCSPTPSS